VTRPVQAAHLLDAKANLASKNMQKVQSSINLFDEASIERDIFMAHALFEV